MSTKSTIKHRWNEDEQTGYNLYSDFIDDCIGAEAVTLELTGVEFEANSDGRVSVTLPIEWAKELGLIDPAGK